MFKNWVVMRALVGVALMTLVGLTACTDSSVGEMQEEKRGRETVTAIPPISVNEVGGEPSPTLTGGGSPAQTLAPVPESTDWGYGESQDNLHETYDPCFPSDASESVCEVRDVSSLRLFSGGIGIPAFGENNLGNLEEILATGLKLAEASPVHHALQATSNQNTVRCDWRGVARTADQREDALRYWFALDDDETIPSSQELKDFFGATFDDLNLPGTTTDRANFLSLAQGGFSEDYLFLTCYVDYSGAQYFLGDGPTTVTVAYDQLGEVPSYGLYRKKYDAGDANDGRVLNEGEYEAMTQTAAMAVETSIADSLGTHLGVVFVAPMGAHHAISIQAWQAVAQWDVQRPQGSSGNGSRTGRAVETPALTVVQYGASPGNPEYSRPLDLFRQDIQRLAASDGKASDRTANINDLESSYRQIGAYGDITPGDDSTATFTPTQPPEAYECAGATAVSNWETNLGLVHDCEALLGAQDILRGSGTLNWSKDLAISSWTGVTNGGTPTRVTGLDLDDESLTGTIPSELGTLYELTTLDLSDNSLTGSIPRELGWLYNLAQVRLSGNSLTGCLPVALRDVASKDFSSMSLLYCQPPTVENLQTGTPGETSVPLTWNSVAGATNYRVEKRSTRAGEWTVDSETITTTSHTVRGLPCEGDHQFRVSARGSGAGTYAAAWSEATAAVSASTVLPCVSPVFDAESYAFRVAASAMVNTVVDSVSATDPNNDGLTYSITAGKFAIGSSTGAITVAGALNETNAPATYSLTVQASDGSNTATATVVITVTDVVENGAPVFGQASYSFSVMEDTSVNASVGTVTATDPENATLTYSISAGNTEGKFSINSGTGAITVAGALDYDTAASYSLTVAASDGSNTATATVTITVTDVVENGAPVFGQASYSFSVLEDAAVNASVGTVTATDPENATLTYSISAGNTEGKFSINSSGGITVAGALDYATTATYSLTVQASDGSDTATATVTITVTESGQLPVPTNLALGTQGETSITLTWGGMTGASQYRVEYRLADDQEWTVADETLTETSHTVEGLTCNSNYQFRVSAHAAAWGDPSTELSASTTACLSPVFSREGHYPFQVAEDARSRTRVGTVSATDPNGDNVTYSITAGNELGEFAINPTTGAITVASDLSRQIQSFIMEVEASDGNGNIGSVRVIILFYGYYNYCIYGGAVPASTVTMLVEDCVVLLKAKAELAGAGILNWNSGLNMRLWDGLNVSGTPSRVTALNLPGRSLTGAIPAGLGNLTGVMSLDLSNNQLTGQIPSELEELTGLATLRLSGNSLTGCIPLALKAVATHDLGSMSLLYCRPPMPEDLQAGTAGETSVPLTWSRVLGADLYRVEYRTIPGGQWTVDSDTITGTSHTVRGLACNGDHQFRVSARVGGTSYATAWGEPSTQVSASTASVCVSPVFGQASYSFSVLEDAAVNASVGTVTATDPENATLTYSISAGNAEGKFSINSGTGAITVAGALDYDTAASYSLTVAASDGSNTATATVTITVTDVVENGAPAFGQAGYSFSVLEDAAVNASVGTVTATDPENATLTYSISAGNAEGKFSINSGTGAITVAGALDYDTAASYSLTVAASDGSNTATATVTITVTDVVENGAPAFGQASYSFSVLEDAAVNASVGTVTATDPENATLTYSISAGNAEGKFSINSGTGAITVAGALDYDTAASYSLTVAASDGSNTATATVTITVTDVVENGAPVFGQASYSFSVLEDAAVNASVGTVTATDPENATLTYSISAGNAEGKFSINSGTGAITVAGALDYDTAASYSLTVAASDGSNTATATVTITVTDVVEVSVSFGQAAYSVAEDAAAGVAIVVMLNADPQREVTVPLTVSHQGGATSEDYTGAASSVTFNAGETSKSFQLTPVDDSVDDDNESILFNFGDLPEAVTAGSPSTATVTIEDNDTAAPVTLWAATLTVGDDGGYLGYSTRKANAIGALTDDDFTWEGTTYTVTNVLYNMYFDHLGVDFSAALSGDTAGITLHVGDLELAYSDAERGHTRQPAWRGVVLDWSVGDTVEMSLTYTASGS